MAKWNGLIDIITVKGGNNTDITGSLSVTGSITTTELSSSGDIIGNNITASGNISVSGEVIATTFTSTGKLTATNLTASIISASDNIITNTLTASYALIENTLQFQTQSSPPTASAGTLYLDSNYDLFIAQ